MSGQVIRAVKTLREMCADRNYNTSEIDKIADDRCIAAVMSRENIQVNMSNDVLLVLYMTLRHNGTTIRADLRKRVDTEKTKQLILVFREMPQNSEVISSKIKDDLPSIIRVEMFCLAELQYNVTRHALVPKHERVDSPKEIQRILKTYGIKKNQLPIIFAKLDPVCRYLGVEPGNIVKVTRVSPTGGEHVVYRYCS